MTKEEFEQLSSEQKQLVIQQYVEERQSAVVVMRSMMGKTPEDGVVGCRILSIATGMLISALKAIVDDFDIERAIGNSMSWVEHYASAGLGGMPQDLSDDVVSTANSMTSDGASEDDIREAVRAKIVAHFESLTSDDQKH